MIWADRIGLGLWAIWMVLGAVVVSQGLINGANLQASAIATVFFMPATLAIPVWLILRIVDFMLGGPGRRRLRGGNQA